MLSPDLRKRGRLGCTIKGFDASVEAECVATDSDSVNANARKAQVVLASGTVYENCRCPCASVSSMGAKNARGTSLSR